MASSVTSSVASSVASSFAATVPSHKKITTLGNPKCSSYRKMAQLGRPPSGISFTPIQCRRQISANAGRMTLTRPGLVGNNMPYQPLLIGRRLVSATALNATMQQTESAPAPVTFLAKEKSPMLDDGGAGFNGNETPPYYRGDDGGGGGGGGGGRGGFGGEFPWGPFWFFVFLRFLMYFFSKDREKDVRFKIRTGKNKSISHFLQ